jgi:hypothetical protein
VRNLKLGSCCLGSGSASGLSGRTSNAGQEDGRALCLDTRLTCQTRLYMYMPVHSLALALLAVSIDATAILFTALRRTNTHNVGPVRLGIGRSIH